MQPDLKRGEIPEGMRFAALIGGCFLVGTIAMIVATIVAGWIAA